MAINLKMEVYNSNLELQGILETWDSLMVEEWAFEAGSFSLESVLNSETKQLLIPDNIIWLEGETAGIIEYVQMSASSSGYTLSIKGSLLVGILGRRILWGSYNLSGSPPQIMYNVVSDCAITPTRGNNPQTRKIPNLSLDGEPPVDSRSIRKQSTGSGLLEFLKDVGQSNSVAYGVKFSPVGPQMLFWARLGIDRTIDQSIVEPVLYSTELDDVLSSEYSYDSSGFKNLALVAGEGEGAQRTTEVVGDSSLSGMNRRELYVDARDLQKNSDPDAPMTDSEYKETLQNRGSEKLADAQLVQSFSAVIRTLDPTYEYGRDFFLGDTITVTDERLGVSVSAIVEGVERSFGKEGDDLVLTLGYSLPTISDRLRKVGV